MKTLDQAPQWTDAARQELESYELGLINQGLAPAEINAKAAQVAKDATERAKGPEVMAFDVWCQTIRNGDKEA
jgi:hypothetical protein